MPDYVRANLPVGSCFFTVALLERRPRVLAESYTKSSVPYAIEHRFGSMPSSYFRYIHFNPLKHGGGK
jgi:hypothetical protein